MNEIIFFVKNIKFGSGRDFIFLFRYWDFRVCNQNGCGEMFGVGRCFIMLVVYFVEGFIYFNLGLLYYMIIVKKG